ncbi:MAG: FecR domain-containing protein [Pseudomonadota bacterium]|nr:FecR domain-containing protein [Pseudomonadota bacterium]
MRSVIRFAPVFAILLFLVAAIAPTGQALAADSIGVVKRAQGSVEVERGGQRQPVVAGFALQAADVVHTGPQGAVGITFSDNSLIALGPDTTFAISEYRFDSTTQDGAFRSRLSRGTLSVASGRIAKGGRDQMLVETPATILGVRGTRFLVKVDD